jgi:hypothetical protein
MFQLRRGMPRAEPLRPTSRARERRFDSPRRADYRRFATLMGPYLPQRSRRAHSRAANSDYGASPRFASVLDATPTTPSRDSSAMSDMMAADRDSLCRNSRVRRGPPGERPGMMMPAVYTLSARTSFRRQLLRDRSHLSRRESASTSNRVSAALPPFRPRKHMPL